MTPACHAALDRLANNPDFAGLSLEALLYEAIRSSSVREVDTVFKIMKAELEAATVDDKLKVAFMRASLAARGDQ